MSLSPKSPRLTFESDFQVFLGELQPLGKTQIFTEDWEEDNSSSSFNFSYLSTSSSLPSLPVIPTTENAEEKEGEEEEEVEEEEGSTVGVLNPTQDAQSFGSPTSQDILSMFFSNPQVGSAWSLQVPPYMECLSRDALKEKVMELVQLLTLKYRLKEPITKAEMLQVVMKGFRNRFPLILEKASKCLQAIFGIEMKEVDSTTQSYILVNSLGLTLCSDQDVPKTGLLIIVLGVIFLEGNCASEENIWDFLDILGCHVGREHLLCGEPWKLLTKDWVQENYLVYRQVLNSDPPRCEFLWGPRAYAETCKMNVLEFLLKIDATDPLSYSLWYEDILREEKERATLRIAPI